MSEPKDIKQIRKSDLVKITCEKCGAQFDYKIHDEGVINDGMSVEMYSVQCPVCRHLMHAPLDGTGFKCGCC